MIVMFSVGFYSIFLVFIIGVAAWNALGLLASLAGRPETRLSRSGRVSRWALSLGTICLALFIVFAAPPLDAADYVCVVSLLMYAAGTMVQLWKYSRLEQQPAAAMLGDVTEDQIRDGLGGRSAPSTRRESDALRARPLHLTDLPGMVRSAPPEELPDSPGRST